MMHSGINRSANRTRPRRGFSLIELLLAIFILGVGVISVAAVFPAGIVQQRRTQDDVYGPVVAESALSIIRSRLSQGDFGTFEEFGFFGPESFESLNAGVTFPNRWLHPGDAYTQAGDWPWIRPSIAAVPSGSDPSDRSYAGDIDIFSARAARASTLVPAEYGYSGSNVGEWSGDWLTAEFSGGLNSPGYGNGENGTDPGGFLFGIPFNRGKFDFFAQGEDPLVEITQEERFWPAGSGYQPGLARPQYAWDCMFRRFQGRVQVAIFVYRLNVGGAVDGYAVCRDDGINDFPRNGSRPPIPSRVDLAARGNAGQEFVAVNVPGGGIARYQPLVPAPGVADGNIVPGDGAQPDYGVSGAGLVLDPYFEGWQSPGQWLIDPYGRTHRVLQGRRNRSQGPVRLSRSSPVEAPTTAHYNPLVQSGDVSWQDRCNQVRSLWFVPPVDRRGISLTPVYVSVRDL